LQNIDLEVENIKQLQMQAKECYKNNDVWGSVDRLEKALSSAFSLCEIDYDEHIGLCVEITQSLSVSYEDTQNGYKIQELEKQMVDLMERMKKGYRSYR